MSENIFQQFYCIAIDVSTYSHSTSYYTNRISYKIDTVYNGGYVNSHYIIQG